MWEKRFARAFVSGSGYVRLSCRRRSTSTREAILGGIGRGREIQVHVLDEARDGPRQRFVLRVPGELGHARGGQRKVAGRVAYHRVAGLEAFDALFLRVDGVEVGPEIARNSLRKVGNVPGGARQIVLQAFHAGNEGGQGIEIRERIGLHAGDLDAPVRGELLDLPDEIDGCLVALLAAAAGAHVEDSGSRQKDDRDDHSENDRVGFHGCISSDSPASVLMNATIASLSSSGASRPS